MTVRLMLTCLSDAFFGEVGIATVRVLEHAGCTVQFPDEQTCCGQPPFNAGDWKAAMPIARRSHHVFQGDIPVVIPSASCAAMMTEGYGMMGVPPVPAYELSEFLLNHLGVTRWPLRGSGLVRETGVAFHRSCHGRMIGLKDTQERLLSLVGGIRLLPFDQQEQCCGFGGAFSATHGALSEGIGLEKLRCICESGARTLVSGDMGCLMHLHGLIKRHGLPLRIRHYVEILAEALPE